MSSKSGLNTHSRPKIRPLVPAFCVLIYFSPVDSLSLLLCLFPSHKTGSTNLAFCINLDPFLLLNRKFGRHGL